MRTTLLIGAAAAALIPTLAHASNDPVTAPTSAPAPADTPTDGQTDTGKDIIVTGVIARGEKDVLSGTSVLSDKELTRDLKPTIGETLAKLPGVSASSFGPNASKPILRGFQGDRVRVLSDGIGAVDVSNTSADHAVVIDPLLADRVEVLRGPAALLYGSSAVGGVVNVIDSRIPRTVPDKGYRLNGIATYGSASNERSGGLAGDVALTKNVVFHVDGSYLQTDDLKIGGYVLSPIARAQANAAALAAPNDPIDFAATARLKGTLPNSAAKTWTAGAGLALITDGGSLGVAYSHYDSLYGIPIRYALNPGDEQEAPRLDLVQNRLDLRAEVNATGFLKSIRLRAAAAQYRHFELEEDNSIGTAFYNKGIEARLELLQSTRGGWSGASGVQFFNRDFNVVGDEAFLPRNNTEQVGLFTLQQFEFGRFKAEAGARYEQTNLTARTLTDDLRFFRGSRSFSSVSASAGASYGLSDDWRIGLNVSRTERAPSDEELFANGPHAGTQAYELGNPNFKLEKSWGFEATLHGHGPGYSIDASAYYNTFSNYIYDAQAPQATCEAAAAPSGRTVDLPCFVYTQANARYYGFEVDASLKLATIGAFAINADGVADYVHANIVNVGPVPRIPPLRLLGGIEAQSDRLSGRIEVEHVFDQNRIAAFETPTSGYTMVNASINIAPWSSNKTSLTLSANNIFDVDARRASSVLKDFAPLAGRDIRVTLKVAL
ncbi:MAG: TonB-dependent receptor [Sphingomonas sp.]|uniref:TonB-dependent receptor n=1 Tax=Sphingomonas sp. TaxID=28214 RepID=UPI001AD56FDF|nr:TonB-dependent receptor [Sphingomonas sp.]MBN8816138.1 TonB-dependent receptor [Sphingomonas sp.]